MKRKKKKKKRQRILKKMMHRAAMRCSVWKVAMGVTELERRKAPSHWP